MKDFRWHKTTHSPNWYEITPPTQENQQTTPAVEAGSSESVGVGEVNVLHLEGTTESAVVNGGITLCGFECGSGTNTATCSTTPAAVEDDDEM